MDFLQRQAALEGTDTGWAGLEFGDEADEFREFAGIMAGIGLGLFSWGLILLFLFFSLY